MCGILGYCDLKGGRFSDLNSDGIKDRGPDNIGKFKDKNVGLYHTRLAIIDNKESSNQPIINGSYILICNGEIYNHKELRRELKNFKFNTSSDCEVIIAVYDKYGTDGFIKLDGMYSFALYDRLNNRLILHKDSVGKKPLYYFYKEDQYIIFSSNVTAIKDNISENFMINLNQIEYYEKNRHMHPKNSIYNEIYPLMPGEYIQIDIFSKKVNKKRVNECFKFDIDFTNNNTIKQKIFKLIKKAIHKRLEDVTTPVVLFSGGIDSTIIAYEALKYNTNTKLLSIKQPLFFMNDEPYVRQFEKKMGVKVDFVNIMNFDFVENIDKFIKKLDQPFGVPSYYYLSQLALQAKSFDNVLFTGDGADEVFFGYRRFEDWIDENSGTKETLLNIPLSLKYSKYGSKQANEDLIGHGFVKVDKSTAENQMEARCPFLDKELIAFVRQIPAQFWRNKNVKFILKEYLINEGFSKKYVYRKKIGFAFPFRYIMVLRYRYIRSYIEKNIELLHRFKLNIDTPNYVDLYKNFDYYFNIYALLKFLENEN